MIELHISGRIILWARKRVKQLEQINQFQGNDHKQNADYYFFVRIDKYMRKAWIVGYYECKKFFEDAQFINKGQTYGGFNARRAAAYAILNKNLKRFKNGNI